jgi:hypothetical protein
MTWIVLDSDDSAIIEEIEGEGDRGAALIAQQFLDNRLLQTIQTRMHRHTEIEANLFRGKGGLAPFASRIDFGFLLQLYPDKTRRLMHRIRDVRNDFAHTPTPIKFDTQHVADRCHAMERDLDAVIQGWIAFHAQLVDSCQRAPRDTIRLPSGGWALPPLESPREAYMGAVKTVMFFPMMARLIWSPEFADLPASSQ